MTNKVVRVFLDTDMRLSFEGLRKLAILQKVDFQKLGSHEHVVFLNTAKNRLKVYSSNKVLSYYHKDKGSIDPSILGHIATTFASDGSVDFVGAELKMLKSKLGKSV